MLQLELVKTEPYLACGRQNIKEVYKGTNVSDAEVEITHHNRHSAHELSSSVGVAISHHEAPAPYVAKVFKTIEEAKRWAETQVCMSWDIGEEV